MMNKHITVVRTEKERATNATSIATAERTFALIDFENLLGRTRERPPWATSNVGRNFNRIAALGRRDHIVVGSRRISLLSAGRAFPGCRLVLGRGVKGADHALLEASADVEWIACHYARVVLGSGDGILAQRIHQLAQTGIEVGLVARAGAISRQLRLAAHWVRDIPRLDEEPHDPTVAGSARVNRVSTTVASPDRSVAGGDGGALAQFHLFVAVRLLGRPPADSTIAKGRCPLPTVTIGGAVLVRRW